MLANAPAIAIAPPAAPSQGPQDASWNVGGNAIASAEADATAAPPMATRAAPILVPRARNHHATPRRATAATAAIIDHRTLGTHAPSRRSPAPVLVQGPIVATTARTAPAKATLDRGTAVTSSGGAVSPGSPSSAARHSGPITRPRTGTAQGRQIGSSHELQRATAALPGWWTHRSWVTVPDVSVLALVPSLGGAGVAGPGASGVARIRSSASTAIAYGLAGPCL